MMLLTDVIQSSPTTSDGFIVSVLLLVGAIIALFVTMKNNLRKK